MSGRLYSPAAHIISPRFEVVDGAVRILLDPEGLSWLVLDDAATARELGVAAWLAADALEGQEQATRAPELGEARRPILTLRPACTCDPGEGTMHHPYCDLYALDPAPAHAGDGTPGPDRTGDQAPVTTAPCPGDLTVPLKGDSTGPGGDAGPGQDRDAVASPAPQPAPPWEPAEGDQIAQWAARERAHAEAAEAAGRCRLCEAPLNRDGSCSRSCAGVGNA